MGMHVKEPENPVSKAYAKRDDAALYSVREGDNWESVAKLFDITPKELIYWNFRTANPDEVNWYLREYVGCTKSRDGKNYRFSGSDKPGVIWFPKSAVTRKALAVSLAIPDTSSTSKTFILADNHLTKGFIRKNRGGRWAQVHSVGSSGAVAVDSTGQVKSHFPDISFTLSDEHAGHAFMQLEGIMIGVVMFDFERRGSIYHWMKFQDCLVTGFNTVNRNRETGESIFEVSINYKDVEWPKTRK